ncbi:MAG: NAD(P)/FAD-dependent oxidoreductase [Chloroflexi bacterium]|nr:NAD(P)/FAD-dependent oxidoreductase [Chloroflexota bacterium]MBI5830543.1 NAD(P)/FAD-dependent oxidoreductase [Chloroflexota bacterium]
MTEPLSIIVIGGGAAVTAAEARPGCRVLLLEHSRRLLAKVRISGGGRCNVTHATFDPAQLVGHYLAPARAGRENASVWMGGRRRCSSQRPSS